MRISHSQKKKIAKRLMSQEETANHIPIFQSKNWLARKKARQGIAEKEIPEIKIPEIKKIKHNWLVNLFKKIKVWLFQKKGR